MVSNRDLENVVEQINKSYASLSERVAAVETAMVALSTLLSESKEKPKK